MNDLMLKYILSAFILSIITCCQVLTIGSDKPAHNEVIYEPLIKTDEIITLTEDEKYIASIVVQEYFSNNMEYFNRLIKSGEEYIVFLQLLDKNPSRNFLGLIDYQSVALKPANEGVKRNTIPFDLDTKYYGELFRISKISIIENNALVEAYTYKGFLNAFGYEISLKKEEDEWRISKWEFTWES